jgi:DNA ligase-associated metallophosphoesterase
MKDTVEIELLGEEFLIMPQRGLYWIKEKTLIISDPHFGKDSSFRSQGVYVPEDTSVESLDRLDNMIEKLDPFNLLILGDFYHNIDSRSPATDDHLIEWRNNNSQIAIKLVRGNHDLHAGDPPDYLKIESVDAPIRFGKFLFSHNASESKNLYNIHGHLHPAVKLRGKAKQVLRLPCFLFTEDHAVIPAFGSFTGNHLIYPRQSDRVFCIADNKILDVSKNSNKAGKGWDWIK